jgi:hypothetical protein
MSLRKVAKHLSGYLKLQMFWRTGKGNDIPDIRDAGDHHEKTLESQAKTRVRHGAETTAVEIPPVGLGG